MRGCGLLEQEDRPGVEISTTRLECEKKGVNMSTYLPFWAEIPSFIIAAPCSLKQEQGATCDILRGLKPMTN